MAISVLQRTVAGNAAASPSIALAFGSNLAANSVLIAIGVIDGTLSSMSGVTDSQGLKWSLLPTTQPGGASDARYKAWYASGSRAAACTVTLTTGYEYTALHIYEVAGLADISSFYKTNAAKQSSATSLSSGSITNSVHDSLLAIGVHAHVDSSDLAFTLGSGYSNLNKQWFAFLGSATQEQVITNPTTVASTMTLASNTTTELSAVLTFSAKANSSGTSFNNYQFVAVGDGMSTGERIH